MIVLVAGGEVLTPSPAGHASVLALNGAIACVGPVEAAALTPPRQRLDQLRTCMLEHRWRIDQLLPLVTTNPARVLKLSRKGVLEPGADADIVVLRRDTLEPVHVVANGRVLMWDGVMAQQDRFLQTSARRIRLDGHHA